MPQPRFYTRLIDLILPLHVIVDRPKKHIQNGRCVNGHSRDFVLPKLTDIIIMRLSMERAKTIMSKSNNKEYYVIKVRKDYVNWVFQKDSKVRSTLTLLAEIVTIITFILLYLS